MYLYIILNSGLPLHARLTLWLQRLFHQAHTTVYFWSLLKNKEKIVLIWVSFFIFSFRISKLELRYWGFQRSFISITVQSHQVVLSHIPELLSHNNKMISLLNLKFSRNTEVIIYVFLTSLCLIVISVLPVQISNNLTSAIVLSASPTSPCSHWQSGCILFECPRFQDSKSSHWIPIDIK